MAHADALSRNPVSVELEIARVDITEGNWVTAAQLQDEQLNRILQTILQRGTPIKMRLNIISMSICCRITRYIGKT